MKKSKNLASTIFLILSILFLAYGVYAVIYSIDYVNTYTTTSTMTLTGTIQYIVTASMAYFGFGLILMGISIVLLKINRTKMESPQPAKAPAPQKAPAPVQAKPVEAPAPQKASAPVQAKPVEAPAPQKASAPVQAKPVEAPAPQKAPAPVQAKPVEAPAPQNPVRSDSVPLSEEQAAEISRDIKITSNFIRDIFEA